jgi:hypothetical protein
MINFALLALASIAAAASLQPVDDQAYFALFAETKVTRIAGMPVRKMPKLPPGIKLPAAIAIPGMPTRLFNVRLWSPSIAPDSATASLTPPGALKLGNSLPLELYRPTAVTPGSGSGATGSGGGTPSDITIKVYWGSSETVKEGQPKVFKLSDLAPEQLAEMSKRSSQMNPNASESYFYKPNWTTAYWPPARQQSSIDDDASLVGSYSLDSSYTGKVAMDVPAGIDFLAAIDVTSPDLSQKVDMDKSISFGWSPIAGALGELASIFAMEGQNTMILWSSSENYTANVLGDNSYLQMSEVRQRVEDHSFLGPDTSRVSIPAGIFKDADVVMLNMVAYGPGAATDKTQPLARLQTKSTLSLLLGGKKMKR